MPALALFALANLKHDLEAFGAWLSHRSFWQLMFGAALIFAGYEYLTKLAEQRHSTKVEKQLSKCTQHGKELQGQLDSISSKRNEQKIQTETRIVSVREKIKEADGRAEKVESAPLPGGCRTPPEISQADL